MQPIKPSAATRASALAARTRLEDTRMHVLRCACSDRHACFGVFVSGCSIWHAPSSASIQLGTAPARHSSGSTSLRLSTALARHCSRSASFQLSTAPAWYCSGSALPPLRIAQARHCSGSALLRLGMHCSRSASFRLVTAPAQHCSGLALLLLSTALARHAQLYSCLARHTEQLRSFQDGALYTLEACWQPSLHFQTVLDNRCPLTCS